MIWGRLLQFCQHRNGVPVYALLKTLKTTANRLNGSNFGVLVLQCAAFHRKKLR
jgi:hypothetical protein